MNDSLLNVLLWFSTKQYDDKANLLFLIPSAYYAFEPTTALLEKMNKVFEGLKNKGVMTQQAIHDWKSDQILQQNIVSYTMNDPDRFDESTPTQIIKSRTAMLEKNISDQKKLAKETIKPYENDCEKRLNKEKKKMAFLNVFLPPFVVYGIVVILGVGSLIGLYFLLSINNQIPFVWKCIIDVAILVIQTIATILLSSKNRVLFKIKRQLGDKFSKKCHSNIQKINEEKEKLKKLY